MYAVFHVLFLSVNKSYVLKKSFKTFKQFMFERNIFKSMLTLSQYHVSDSCHPWKINSYVAKQFLFSINAQNIVHVGISVSQFFFGFSPRRKTLCTHSALATICLKISASPSLETEKSRIIETQPWHYYNLGLQIVYIALWILLKCCWSSL